MATHRTDARAFRRLAKAHEALLAAAFSGAIAEIRGLAGAATLTRALESRDIDKALTILQLNEITFAPLDEGIRGAYVAGGAAVLEGLPRALRRSPDGIALVLRFQAGNPRAADWGRRNAAGKVVEIVEEQRRLIRSFVAKGLAEGRNPRSVALDLIGRRAGGKRIGGIVGLHERYADAVVKARAELADPERMANYLRRRARDARFDGTVRRAIREGQALSPGKIDQLAGRYGERLLYRRAETIARTEALTALSAGADEAIAQHIERGVIRADQVTIKWRATLDSRTRDIHRDMHGQEVRRGEAFQSPTGARLLYPRDSSLGAGGVDTVQCRCYGEIRIDYLSGLGGSGNPSRERPDLSIKVSPTKEQRAALRSYTGLGYKDINAALRNGWTD